MIATNRSFSWFVGAYAHDEFIKNGGQFSMASISGTYPDRAIYDSEEILNNIIGILYPADTAPILPPICWAGGLASARE
jgi:hypothetical protein